MVTTASAVRLVLGGLWLAVPGPALRAVGAPDHDDPHVRAVTRILGLRLVVQAGLAVRRGGRSTGLDAALELTHAASMVPVAIVRPAHRRAASVSAAAATGLALLDLVEAR
jgi:hypothetical protein